MLGGHISFTRALQYLLKAKLPALRKLWEEREVACVTQVVESRGWTHI